MISCQAKKLLHTATGKVTLDVGFTLAEGELAAIYGPSGAGKTTILKILAGLVMPDEGNIDVAGETWTNTQKQKNVPVHHRNIGMVFQDYALFPNMTVAGNLRYALQRGQNKDVVDEVATAMELTELMPYGIDNLSGGQKQRVALARALVRRPKLLLLDEPLSALDAALRYRLQHYIMKAHKSYGCTTLLVSHDAAEIYRLANRVLVLEQGKIVKQGTPAQIFGSTGANLQVPGQVISVTPAGDRQLITVIALNQALSLTLPASVALQPGDQMMVNASLTGGF